LYDTKHKKDLLMYLLFKSWCDTFVKFSHDYLCTWIGHFEVHPKGYQS